MEIKGKVHCFFEQSGEEWRDIDGFERIYQVSNLGRVRSLPREVRANRCGVRTARLKILSTPTNSAGYSIAVLCKEGKKKCVMVHRLVAAAFIPNPLNFTEVNHKDENKCNNTLSNLEWCDRRYNANYGTGVERCAKQKYKPVNMIDIKSGGIIRTFCSALDAMKITGVNRKQISMVCNGRVRSAGGYKWSFYYGNKG